jgi:2-oxoglutarate/2-oxoacid ferredoxin oxidoreductase subunit beta
MLFGRDNEKGIRFNPDTFTLEVIDATSAPEQVLRHDETNRMLAQLLVELSAPVALGVVYKNPGDSFEKSWYARRKNGLARSSSVTEALHSSNTWVVT